MTSKLREFLEEVKQREQHMWQETEIPDGVTATRKTLRTLRRMVEKVTECQQEVGAPCGECQGCWTRQELEKEIENN